MLYSAEPIICIFPGSNDTLEDKEKETQDLLIEYRLPKYDFANGRLVDYGNLLVLFGYLVMFSPPFPMAAVIIALSLYFEAKCKLNTNQPLLCHIC
jgi:Calcium-activated chloride channel